MSFQAYQLVGGSSGVLIAYGADFFFRGVTTLMRRWALNPSLPTDWMKK